jgi:probable H4MPT-linked C1 transfer pathway protein
MIVGWDVGGANIKAASLRGPSPCVVERPFALWREPGRLADVLAEVAQKLGRAEQMAVTMTAELADCYATKREGVGAVLDAFETAFPDARLRIFGVDARFRSVAAARRWPLRVAAANWMASATLVAEMEPDALFIDVGSTTTDVVPIVGGRVVARGHSDPARLRSGELVYTGALRTPVSAIVRALPWRGRCCRVAAEHFAIAADAHLWLARIAERDYTCETADGRGRGREEAGARLARMVCADFDLLRAGDITAIAERIAQAQVRQIASGIRQVLRRLGRARPSLAVLAGQGAFLAREAAEAQGLAVCGLEERLGPAAARAAPAAAVAHLLAREKGA